MGTPEFAVPSLELLHRNHYPIPAVVTGPDRPRGRGQSVSPTPVALFAEQHRLPLLRPSSLRDPSFVSQLSGLHADIFVVVAFRILPPDVFRLPRLASFNLHASLLPRYRGAAPINRAIMNGETETGVTTFMLAEKVDTGGVLLRKPVPIRPEDDAGSLHDRLAVEGSMLVLDTVRLIEGGTYRTLAQDESQATPAPKIRRDDCRIDWRKPAVEIHNLIRGLSPSPAAWTLHGGRVLKIYRSAVVLQSSPKAGFVSVSEKGLLVGTGEHSLSLLEVQQEGKKRIGIEEFLRGYRFLETDRLG